jgi:hypothetical protein
MQNASANILDSVEEETFLQHLEREHEICLLFC